MVEEEVIETEVSGTNIEEHTAVLGDQGAGDTVEVMENVPAALIRSSKLQGVLLIMALNFRTPCT